MRTALLILGSLLPLLASLIYIVSIVRGKSKPQRTTRLLLMLITGLSFITLVAGHDTSGVWLALVSFIQGVVIWVLSLWRGIGNALNRLDFACLLLCALGVVLWLTSGQSIVGLIASIVADLIACVPSLVKTWRLPHTESLWFFGLDVLAALLIAAAGPYGWQALLFPVYIAAVNATYVLVIVARVKQHPAQ